MVANQWHYGDGRTEVTTYALPPSSSDYRDMLRRAILPSFDPDLDPCNHYDTVCDWCERLPHD